MEILALFLICVISVVAILRWIFKTAVRRNDKHINAIGRAHLQRLGMASTVDLNAKLMASHLAHTKDSARSRFTQQQKDAL